MLMLTAKPRPSKPPDLEHIRLSQESSRHQQKISVVEAPRSI